MIARRVFVLGGAASGKSVWAEEAAKSYGLPMVYLATSTVFDAEMARKVKIHKERRSGDWRTIETPIELAAPLANLADNNVVLIDCATMWLSNVMMADASIEREQEKLMAALRGCAASWIVVSNEVGQGIVPDNALARRFREAQGRLNIALAKEADLVVQVVAGLPQVLKGEL